MSAVATKEESWLNIAQVTESLWPVDNIKREKKNGYIISHGFGKQFYLQLRAAGDSDHYQSNLVNTRHYKSCTSAFLAIMDLIKVFLSPQLHSNF